MFDSATVQQLLHGNAQPLLEAADAVFKAVQNQIKPAEVTYFEPRMRNTRGHFAVLSGYYAQHIRPRAINVFHHHAWSGDRPARWHGVFPGADHLAGASAPVSEPVLASFSAYMQNITSRCLLHSEARFAVFPTARFLTLPGIARAVSQAPGLRGSIIGVMETIPVPDCEDARLVTGAFRESAEILRNSNKPLLLVAESRVIAGWLLEQGFSSEQLLVAPFPAAARLADSRQLAAPRVKTLRVGALGASRPVQNPDCLARFLLETEQRGIDLLIRLDLPSAAQPLGMSAEALCDELLRRGIGLLPANLDQNHYDRLISNLDIMLLPYGERYQTIGSGIFLECLCAGVTPLVPKGTTMETLLEELGGGVPVLESLTPAAIAAALDACREDPARLQLNARARRDAWLAHPHGPLRWAGRLDAFLDG